MNDDPMEQIIAQALDDAGYAYTRSIDVGGRSIDFHLTVTDIYVEVKRFHTPRSILQMEKVENIVVVQGERAVRALAAIIRNSGPSDGAGTKKGD